MFREMRRKDRLLTEREAMEILAENAYGILAAAGNGEYPYGVPLHYVLIDGALYFHGAKADGLKTECIEGNPKVCFTVVESADGVKCRSVIVFGTVENASSSAEKVLEKLIEKFVPSQGWEQAKAGIPFAKDKVLVQRLVIKHISAKRIDKPEGR